ncbi:MAG TPA: hypothetical protein VF755_26580 [Catenuloplanes sp.]|jgi:hypothetical protein
MTDRTTDPDLRRVQQAAAAFTGAVRETERFLDRMGDTPDPAAIAEYANLAAREEAARADRRAALTEFGLRAPSIDDTGV